jgi:ABC-2 type transport system permease protein
VIRALVTGFVMHFKMLARGGFELSIVTFWPAVYATLGYYIYRAGQEPKSLFYVSLGSTMMAMWSTTAFACGGAIQRQRWLGTLELMVAAPIPFIAVLIPITVASTAIGIYAFATTVVFGRVVYGIPITVAHPLLFAVSIPVAILAIGALGLLMASVLVLYRYAGSLASSTEYPVWLISGLLVPLSLLPSWSRPISWVLAPTWGIDALRAAAFGGPTLRYIGLCLLATAAYSAVAVAFLAHFERLARARATLSLT